MGPIGYSGMSVNNYQSTLRNILEERIPHLHGGGSLNSRMIGTSCHMYGSFNLMDGLCESKVCVSRNTFIIQSENEYLLGVVTV
jgi:hypothetical protein